MEVKDGNEKVRHAVAIVKNGMIVGHMPQVLAIFSWFFLNRGGTIKTVVTRHRKFGNGLEVPCDYIYTGTAVFIYSHSNEREGGFIFPPLVYSCIAGSDSQVS